MALKFTTSYPEDSLTLFRYYKKLAERAMEQVTDGQLLTVLDGEANSIAIIVKHMAGNMRSRWMDFLTSDGEKPDRHRDAEFDAADALSRQQIMTWWNGGWTIALAAIDALAPEDLERTIYIRGEAMTVVEALNRSVTHTAYHVGQLAYLARHFAGASWQSLTIPKRAKPAV
jgi:uncharacterized damage-inducible protein DinB